MKQPSGGIDISWLSCGGCLTTLALIGVIVWIAWQVIF